MRLQLTVVTMILAIAVAGAAGCASNKSTRVRTDGRGHSDRTTRVASPGVSATVRRSESFRVDGHWKADVISAATPVMAAPDTVSRATEYTEVRHEGGVGTEWKPESDLTLGGAYTLSLEPDNTSHTVTASVSRKLFDEQSTLSVGGRFNWNGVGATDMPQFHRELWIVSANLGWTQTLDASKLLRFNYALTRRVGYQANPYRYIPIWGGAADGPRFVLREHVPETRTRHSGELLGKWALSYHVFLRTAYRFYIDDWSVRSHSLRAAVWWELPEDWLRLRVRTRGYRQTGAYFFEARYTDRSGYRTGDYRLSAMSKLEGGVRADLRLSSLPVGRQLVGSASYDLARYWFDTYPVFDSMFAHIVSLSLQMEFP